MLRLGERLSRVERIRRSKEFRRIQRAGRRRPGRYVLVIACRGSQPWTRIGLTVSRKVGGAVVRNRVKRRLREIFRRNKAHFPTGMDLVLIARPAAARATFDELRSDLIATANRPAKRTHPKRSKKTRSRPRNRSPES